MTPSQTLLSPPGPLVTTSTAGWAFLIGCAAIMVVAIPYCAHLTLKTRTVLPLAVFLSAMTWLPFEGYMDTLMGVQYAGNQPAIAYHIFGRPVPLATAAAGGMFFLGGWFVYRLFLAGASIRTIMVWLIPYGLVDWLLEMVGSHYHVMGYYNNDSLVLGLPVYSVVQNTFLYVVFGWMILVLAPYVKGWRAVLFLPVIPGAYFAYTLGCTWVAFMAVHTDAPPLVAWPAFTLATAMNLAVPLLLMNSRTVVELREQPAAATEPPVVLGAHRDPSPVLAGNAS